MKVTKYKSSRAQKYFAEISINYVNIGFNLLDHQTDAVDQASIYFPTMLNSFGHQVKLGKSILARESKRAFFSHNGFYLEPDTNTSVASIRKFDHGASARQSANMQAALAYRINDVCRETGLGRTTIYAAIKSGALPARKVGRRTLILAADLQQFLTHLPTLHSSQSDESLPPTVSALKA